MLIAEKEVVLLAGTVSFCFGLTVIEETLSKIKHFNYRIHFFKNSIRIFDFLDEF